MTPVCIDLGLGGLASGAGVELWNASALRVLAVYSGVLAVVHLQIVDRRLRSIHRCRRN
jgi:hypothetical protein